MANFIFNWASAALTAATLDLSTGNYYAHLVTTVPALGHSTVADLILPTTSGYASTDLTGLSYNTTRWTFDSFNFPKYNFISAPTGVVICKRTGAVPASTDGIICYSDFNNSIGQGISLQVGIYVVNLQFGASGAINFSYRYQYSSGAFVSGPAVPLGLIYLIGTKNNTLGFVNPFSATTSYKLVGTTSIGSLVTFTDQIINGAGSNSGSAFDFGLVSVKPTTFGFNSTALTNTIELYGSINLAAFDTVNITGSANWTLLGSVTNPVLGWNFISVANTSYWRYLKIRTSNGANGFDCREIELYNSSALSPTANFV